MNTRGLGDKALFRCAVILGSCALVPRAHAAQEAWRVPRQAQFRRNPLPASAASGGESLFASHCASCHGPRGKGDGLAAAALNPRPQDLTRAVVQKQSDGALFWKISTGRGAMPAWAWLTERERWSLVWAIRGLARGAEVSAWVLLLALVLALPRLVRAEPQPAKPSLELSGFVAAQVTFDSNDAVRQNHLISVDGQGKTGRLGWAFDATRLNLVGLFDLGPLVLEGRAEADMQSPIYFRIRHVYASVLYKGTKVLLGQTDTLIGNIVGPHNFNNDWMFTQGNAYDRLPQLRVSHDTGRFFVAAALLPNVHGTSDVIPHAQARLMVRFAGGEGSVGAAGHFGYSNRVKHPVEPNREVDGVLSYLVSIDAGIPLGPVLLSAQAWIGAGAAHGVGGHAIGNPLFVVGMEGTPVSPLSAGGFLDLFGKIGSRFALGAAGGVNAMIDTVPAGVPMPLANNATALVYATIALRPNWIFALEAQGARTERSIDKAALEIYTALYNGRLLLGQRYAF